MSSETEYPTPVSEALPRRGIKSYVLRAGRMTIAQTRGLEEVYPRLGLTLAQGCLDLDQVFGRHAPRVVEIGFGMGASLLEQARRQPEVDFIGIEVHPPGVGKLLDELDKAGIENVRVFREDALKVLDESLPAASIDLLQLFFPDPWPKKKHHKRRIVQPEFVARVKRVLKPGGRFHMATDWEAYAEHMAQVMRDAPGFENTSVDGPYVPRPESRPLTKFEARGERLGHGVWDLIHRRKADA
ncbi:tRNA (guanosine(46)-N7)-methyltransferase TrmB [Halotalea alkalilenta]|uniref:tRNA (guanine-N(7)-)-methyltransferase n=1 Tax=Halotalea alkalilenta TaxID=376489 RepID=A0A172YBT3_9GAMM|nr:tRNA (guanosine(46)-N7)-methyltransferase TrmB [Halotalea alkalilenta]ANF56711.1 tRNA (guanosine(46)-N7)-methyltransferase TrmB [Halotalea alkalilenta]